MNGATLTQVGEATRECDREDGEFNNGHVESEVAGEYSSRNY